MNTKEKARHIRVIKSNLRYFNKMRITNGPHMNIKQAQAEYHLTKALDLFKEALETG